MYTDHIYIYVCVQKKKSNIPALKGTWCHLPSPYLSMHRLKRLSSSAVHAPFVNPLDESSMDQRLILKLSNKIIVKFIRNKKGKRFISSGFTNPWRTIYIHVRDIGSDVHVWYPHFLFFFFSFLKLVLNLLNYLFILKYHYQY